MRLFDFVYLKLQSPRVPAEFIRKVAAKRGPHFSVLDCEEFEDGHDLFIYFYPQEIILVDLTCGLRSFHFSSVEQLISGMQADAHLRTFLLM